MEESRAARGLLAGAVLSLCTAGFLACPPPSVEAEYACDEKVFDDGVTASALYFGDSLYVMARRFEGSYAPVGMEWGEINTISLGDPYYPWPDATYDPIEITMWEEESGTGLPRYPPIWSTVVTPSDSPAVVRVYPPDTVLASTNYIFLGMRNHEYPDGAEGLCTDSIRDFPGNYLSTDGGLIWEGYSGYGDWHIRACLIYPDAVQESAETHTPLCLLLSGGPSPFRSSALIRYSLSGGCHVDLIVYDVRGALTATLVDGFQHPGTYEVRWDAAEQPGGVYFVRLHAGDFSRTMKAVLLR